MKEDQAYYWNLGAIIEDICLKSGISSNEMTMQGDMSDVVKGLVVNGDEPASTTLQNLAITHFFDVASYGGRLHFIKRGLEPVATIPEEDLILNENENAFLSYKRGEQIDIPMILNIEYYDIEGGINTDLQVSTRGNDSRTLGEEKLQVSEIMDANSAKSAIVKHHKLLIEDQRGEVTFSLPKKYIFLSVGDVIKINDKRLRIEKIDLDLYSQSYTCKYDRASIYRTKIDGIPVNKPTPPPSSVIGKTKFEILDCNILDDRNDALGIYFVVQRTTENWAGALVEISYTKGQSWEEMATIYDEGVMAETLSTLPAHSPYYRDENNEIIVKLLDSKDDIVSYNNFEQLNRQGYIIVGDEIMSYGEAEYLEEGKVKLSSFLRGRRGSEAKAHNIGERVVFLNLGAVSFFEMDIYNLKRPCQIRVTSLGTVNASEVKDFVLQGKSQEEQEPARFKGRKIGDDLLLSWLGIGKKGGGALVRNGDYFLGFNLYLPNKNEPIFLSPSSSTYRTSYSKGKYKICAVNALVGEGKMKEIEL